MMDTNGYKRNIFDIEQMKNYEGVYEYWYNVYEYYKIKMQGNMEKMTSSTQECSEERKVFVL
jgi:hypothetical protein